MRILLKCTPNTQTIPFDYQQKMIGVLHKWLGENQLHDKISLYSFSWLQKLIPNKVGFDCPKGTFFFISFFEEDYLKKLIDSILKDPDMFCGIQVAEIQMVNTPQFGEEERFSLASPVLIKQNIDGNIKFYTYENPESNRILTETILHKMEKAGLDPDATLRIEFDLSYPKKKTKLVTLHGVKNKTNICPVKVSAKPETLRFIWNVGLGNSTGSSFGALN
ncbi:MAG: CRISPR-associated endoribonuclease Cas6 [Bacteroidales bacterium]